MESRATGESEEMMKVYRVCVCERVYCLRARVKRLESRDIRGQRARAIEAICSANMHSSLRRHAGLSSPVCPSWIAATPDVLCRLARRPRCSRHAPCTARTASVWARAARASNSNARAVATSTHRDAAPPSARSCGGYLLELSCCGRLGGATMTPHLGSDGAALRTGTQGGRVLVVGGCA